MRIRVMLGCTAIAVTVACGPSAEEKRTQELQQGAETMAKWFEDMAKGLGAMASGNSDQKPVDPVSFSELQTVFGDLSGWEKGKPTGESMTVPVN